MIKRLKDEAGYSLVEVMVSILILSVAIIPMVAMFDMGLNSVTTSGNYDKARALANGKMEEVKVLSYKDLVVKYPPGTYPPGAPACSTGVSGFSCEIKTNYVNANLGADPNPTSGMQIEVNVTWDRGTYRTTGLKTRGQPD